MAALRPPISGHDNNPTPVGLPAVPTNEFDLPLTWAEMCRFMFAVQSGTRSAESIAGVAGIYHGNEDSEEAHKKKEDEDRANLAVLNAITENQREIIELMKEMLASIAKLLELDPENAGRIREWTDLLEQKNAVDKLMRDVGSQVEKFDYMTTQGQIKFTEWLHNSKISDDPVRVEAAKLVENLTRYNRELITVTYRAEGDAGAMPQHLVYVDDRGKFYIKDKNGDNLYINDLPVSVEEKNKMLEQIDRQRHDTTYTAKHNVEQFGNEAPEYATEFEKASTAYQNELKARSSDSAAYIVVFDLLMAEGREHRERLAAKKKEYDQLMERKARIEQRIEDVKARIGSTPEAAEELKRLEQRLIRLGNRGIDLMEQVTSGNQKVEKLAEVAEYMFRGNYTAETFLDNLPDADFRQRVRDAQDRLRELDAQQADLDAKKETARATRENTHAAAGIVEALRNNPMLQALESVREIMRSPVLMGQVQRNPSDYVTDNYGNIVSYDKAHALFYTERTDPVTHQKQRMDYYDPLQIVSFFRDAWENKKMLGNESELVGLTYKKHLDDIGLTIDFKKIENVATEQSLTLQQNLISAERTVLEQAIAGGAAGAVNPEVAHSAEYQTSAARGIVPDAISAKPDFNTVAPISFTNWINSGAPANGSMENSKKIPVRSMTSDASKH